MYLGDLFIYNTYNGSEDPSNNAYRSLPKLTEAQFLRGGDWETCLLEWLDDEDLLLTVPSRPLTGDELVENILADERNHFFMAGISIMPPQEKLDEIYRKAGLEPVKFGLAKPDLVEITHLPDNKVMWKIIDAKAAKLVKVRIRYHTLSHWNTNSQVSDLPSRSDLLLHSMSELRPTSIVFSREQYSRYLVASSRRV